MKNLSVIAVMGAALLASPAQAAGCWSDATYEAAQMRDFDTMLMVATLRCRIKNVDFSGDYNSFVKNQRPVLAAANREIRSQFARSMSQRAALGAYDDFMTKVANSYGGGVKNMTCNDYAAMARAAAKAPVSRASVIALAQKAGSNPPLPGKRCGYNVAMNEKK